MKKKKILWLSNAILDGLDRGATGTWLRAMSEGLIGSELIELGNITSGNVKSIESYDYGQIRQWVIPSVRKTNNDGLPEQRIVRYYVSAINEYAPDLIHVWGVENYPGLITSRKYVNYSTLIEIQGLKGAIAEFIDGGLSFKDKLMCIGIREIILQSSIFQMKKSFERWGKFENEIILSHKFITAPSNWMAAHVKAINPDAFLFQNEIPLRRDFFLNNKWELPSNPIIFCSSSAGESYKGFHVLIRALKLLRKRFPNIQLRIAGAFLHTGLRRNGYINWINKQIKGTGLESNIKWLGALNSSQLVQELLRSSVVALPSYVESYGVAHAEAMAVGTPCVCAFNGGSSYLAENEKTALFFQPGDYVMCAFQIERILSNKTLANAISDMAKHEALKRNNTEQIISRQVKIYEEVLAKN
jgi:glycosyltransferase involved in cell wall biosynthesis